MSLSSLTSIPEDPKELTNKKVIESLEAKYQELKNRNQRLLEHLQTREKEFQKEYNNLKSKLEANKNVIRELEDKNLDLKYQLIASKKKEAEQATEITKLKALLKKQNSTKENGRPIQHSKTMGASTINLIRCSPGGDSSTANSDSIHMSPPDGFEAVSRSPLRRTATGVSRVDLPNEEDGHDEKRRNSRLGSSQLVKSMNCLDFDEGGESGRRHHLKVNVEPRCTGIKQKDHLGAVDNLDEVISEESMSPEVQEKKTPFKLPHLKRGEQLDHFSPSKRRNSFRELQLERVKSKASNTLVPENPEYVDKFNKLTQNIVSLGVKPEISIAEAPKDTIKSPINTLEAESPDVSKKSFLKYRNINRKMSTFVVSPSTPNKFFSSPMIQEPGRLFEDFFVIGPNKDDIVNFIQQNPDQNKGNIPPKILFSYPCSSSSLNQPPRTSIPDFTFPFGVDVRRIKLTPSFSGLNSIIYNTSDIEQRGKCFVFPLLSVNLEEEGPTLTLGEVIDSSNPDYLYYIACITFKDFITMTDNKEQIKTLDKIDYWEVNKAMCFMSYYPFTSLFFDILMKILNLLKVERMVKMAELSEKDLTRHEAVDTRFTKNFFETIVRKNLKSLLEAKIPGFASTFGFKLQGSFAETPIEFQIPERSLAHTLEVSWACTLVFRCISYKDLLWFFTAMLLERKLVFLSNNTYLLTATLFVLRSLIKPFKYPFPLIFNLPEVLMVYCDAPGAALIGINRGEEYLKEQGLLQEYPSCIYVCLDEQKLYFHSENNVQTVQFSNFEKNLMTHYVKLNASLKNNFIDAKKANQIHPHKIDPKLTEQWEEREKSIKVLELFKETIEKKILSYVPSKPMYKPDKNLDYDEIAKVVVSKAKEVDKKFLKEFVKTQIFTYYLEQRYEALGLPA